MTEKKLREELRRVQEELRIARCELETSYEEFARRVREEENLRYSNSLLCGDLSRVKDKLALLLAQELLALLRGVAAVGHERPRNVAVEEARLALAADLAAALAQALDPGEPENWPRWRLSATAEHLLLAIKAAQRAAGAGVVDRDEEDERTRRE